MAYFALAAAFICNGIANVLLKLGARGETGFDFKHPVALFAAHWQIAAGCLFFAVNIVFYYLALRTTPVSVAYPVMVVMSFVIINSYAFFVLGENIAPLQVLGYAAIIAGLLLVVSNASAV
jgi:multidrug transporter EmrE-like cation transporter